MLNSIGRVTVTDDGYMRVDDMAGVTECATYLCVELTTFVNWRYRYPDFPQPVRVLTMGPVYSMSAVVAWAAAKWPNRFDTEHSG